VRTLMTLHDGGVTIESALGKGTTASIWFPRSRCMDVAATQSVA
jgi:signal transduction histidine kinase